MYEVIGTLAGGNATVVSGLGWFKRIKGAALLLALLPIVAPAAANTDLPQRVDELTEGMNQEQLEGVRKLIDEKINTRLSIEFGQKLFFFNLEGTRYDVRNARTFFGDVVDLKLRYRIGEHAGIRAGVVAILPFAEDQFDLRWGDYYRDFKPGDHSDRTVNLLQPFLQLSYGDDDFRLVFGDLETPHDHHPLIEYDVYEFLRPAEKGLQVIYDSPSFQQDLYINWREKNIPDNHERFNIGSISRLKWEDGSLGLQILYVHRGGVEFAQDPVVFENISAAVVLDHSLPLDTSYLDRAGIEIVPLYTSDLAPVTESQQSRVDGFGALGSLYLTSGAWRLKAGYWAGSDKVYAEEGLPFARQERFAYAELLLNKKLRYDISVELRLTGGVFGKDLDASFFDQKLVVAWRGDFGLGR